MQGEKRDENEDTHTHTRGFLNLKDNEGVVLRVSPDASTLPASHPSATIENVWPGTRVQAWLLHHKSRAAYECWDKNMLQST